jgi:N-acyl-D-aspartate/D-glutamate deacylase
MTSLSAQRMNLHDRRSAPARMIADLVIFDPDRIIDRATFTRPASIS